MLQTETKTAMPRTTQVLGDLVARARRRHELTAAWRATGNLLILNTLLELDRPMLDDVVGRGMATLSAGPASPATSDDLMQAAIVAYTTALAAGSSYRDIRQQVVTAVHDEVSRLATKRAA